MKVSAVSCATVRTWFRLTAVPPLITVPLWILTFASITVGWLHAVRRGQARLHRGLDVGVPNLILRSDHSVPETTDPAAMQCGDAVLDVVMRRMPLVIGARVEQGAIGVVDQRATAALIELAVELR